MHEVMGVLYTLKILSRCELCWSSWRLKVMGIGILLVSFVFSYSEIVGFIHYRQ